MNRFMNEHSSLSQGLNETAKDAYALQSHVAISRRWTFAHLRFFACKPLNLFT